MFIGMLSRYMFRSFVHHQAFLNNKIVSLIINNNYYDRHFNVQYSYYLDVANIA
jgi:hypothetical protein